MATKSFFGEERKGSEVSALIRIRSKSFRGIVCLLFPVNPPSPCRVCEHAACSAGCSLSSDWNHVAFTSRGNISQDESTTRSNGSWVRMRQSRPSVAFFSRLSLLLVNFFSTANTLTPECSYYSKIKGLLRQFHPCRSVIAMNKISCSQNIQKKTLTRNYPHSKKRKTESNDREK